MSTIKIKQVKSRIGGYGKDAWNVFYMGRKLEGVSPSAFRMPGRR